jgi:hypothetical protein
MRGTEVAMCTYTFRCGGSTISSKPGAASSAAAVFGAELSGWLSAPSWRAGLGDLLPFQSSSDIVYSVLSPPRASGEVAPGKDQKYVV